MNPVASTAGARRLTLLGLGVVALVSLLSAVAFMRAWDDYLEGLEPDYRNRGLLWGQGVQRRLESGIDDIIDDAAREMRLRWHEIVPPSLAADLRVIVDEGDATALVVTRDGAVVAASSGGPGFADPGAGLHDGAGLSVVVRRDDAVTRVFVRGPLTARAPVRDAYVFSAVLEYPPFSRVEARGRTYAWTIVLVYLGMLYALFIAVYLIGRREMTLEFSAKEKEIRLKAIASVAEGIAHEVRNPLNAISLNVQYLERLPGAGKEPTSEDYQRVYVELGKIRKVIDNFVNFARLRDFELTEWDMGEALEDARVAVEPSLEDHVIHFEASSSGDTRLEGDRPKVVRVLTDVLANAVDAVRGRDDRRVTAHIDGRRDGVRVTVRDSGETPTEDVLRNMFDPYFTTRSSAMGLGLTLAKTVVEAHGGTIEAAVSEQGGCVVELAFPRRF